MSSEYPIPNERFRALPQSLQRHARTARLGDDVPALIVHPDNKTPVPWVLWLHGRTVYKELDPGRYSRWVRAGIGAIAIDLPGHGERYENGAHHPSRTVNTLTRCIPEIDGVLASVRELGIFDMSNCAMGGMSAGGMVTMRRLCDPHPFKGATIECTTGDLMGLYFPENPDEDRPLLRVHHDRDEVRAIDTPTHLNGFDPIPLLALHNTGDELIPYDIQTHFIETLRAHYRDRGSDPSMIEFETFSDTGAIQEHAGFGKYASRAKDIQLDFLKRLFGLKTSAG